MAARLSRNVKAKALVGITTSGQTALRLASFRPLANLLVFTRNNSMLTQLSLVWGVRAYYYESHTSTDATFMDIQDRLKEEGYVKKGDIIINTASMPLKEKGKTNMLKIHVVE